MVSYAHISPSIRESDKLAAGLPAPTSDSKGSRRQSPVLIRSVTKRHSLFASCTLYYALS